MNNFIIYFLISGFVSFISYVVTKNIIFTIVILIIFLTYFLIFEFVIKKNKRFSISKSNDQNIFIHDFIISYNTTHDINASIVDASINVSMYLKEEIKMLEEYKGINKLSNLSSYFSSTFYEFFINTIKKCEENKDSINQLTSCLMKENDDYIKDKETTRDLKSKTIIEFVILWVVSLGILAVSRLAISNYFSQISSKYYYLIGIALYFAFLLLSIHLFINTIYRRKENE